MLPRGALDDAEPDEQWLHEASGNEGVSLERAYRHAAFVIWPRSRTLAIVASGGIDGAVAWMAGELDRNAGVADERIGRAHLGADRPWPPGRNDRGEQGARVRMLILLSAVGDRGCAARFLREVILLRYNGSGNEDLVPALNLIGPDAARRFLLDLAGSRFARHPEETLALLRRLDDEYGESRDPAWDEALHESVRAVLFTMTSAALSRPARDEAKPLALDRFAPDTELRFRTEAGVPGRDSERPKRLREQAIRDIFALAWRWELVSEAEATARAVVDQPQVVAPDRALPAALGKLFSEGGMAATAAFATLWRHATDFLLARSAEPPEIRVTGSSPPTSPAPASSATSSEHSAGTPIPGRHVSVTQGISAATFTRSSTATGSTSTT